MKFIFSTHFLTICLFSIAFFSKASLDAKVLIMTLSYNKPEFIRWQHATFKKFLKDDYEFVVFNDAPNKKLSKKIEAACRKLKIECISAEKKYPLLRAPHQ